MMFRCETFTAFGAPVDPDVNINAANTCSSETGTVAQLVLGIRLTRRRSLPVSPLVRIGLLAGRTFNSLDRCAEDTHSALQSSDASVFVNASAVSRAGIGAATAPILIVPR